MILEFIDVVLSVGKRQKKQIARIVSVEEKVYSLIVSTVYLVSFTLDKVHCKYRIYLFCCKLRHDSEKLSIWETFLLKKKIVLNCFKM